MKQNWLAVVFVFIITIFTYFGLIFADPLIKVCDSSQYKRIVEDTCSSVYKRGRFSKIVFNSYGSHHRTRSKRSLNYAYGDLPTRCCAVGCPHTVYAEHCNL